MLVYHLMNEKFGLQAIKDKRLKVALIAELNDPFEFLAPSLADVMFRSAFVSLKRKMSESFGLLCFSENYKNPVLWSHYADKHRGICLGFEIPDKYLSKVHYSKKRMIPDRLLSQNLPEKIKAMRDCLSLKFSHWRYENEQRFFVDLNDATMDNRTGLYFYDFCDHLVLKKVIVGTNSMVLRKTIYDHLELDGLNVESFKVRPAFKSFNVVRNRKESLWK